MFNATIDVSINGVTKTLNRISDGNYSSEYLLRETGSEYSLRIRNTKYSDKTRAGVVVHRHNVELVQTQFPSGASPQVVRKAYIVLENEAGDGLTAPVDFNLGLVDFLTEANILKLVNFES